MHRAKVGARSIVAVEIIGARCYGAGSRFAGERETIVQSTLGGVIE
jgi:hypothetical protein